MINKIVFKIAQSIPIPDFGTRNWEVSAVTQNFISLLLIVISVAGLIGIIFAGYLYITSGGNPEQAQKAKNAFFYSLLGLVIAWGAFAVIKFIIERIF